MIAFKEPNTAKLNIMGGRNRFTKQPTRSCMAAWILLIFIPQSAKGGTNIVSSAHFTSNDFIFPSSSLFKMLISTKTFSNILIFTDDFLLITILFHSCQLISCQDSKKKCVCVVDTLKYIFLIKMVC